MTAAAPALELRGITKRFPGVVANDEVDLVAPRGAVHALIGENGAGKSTLMNILYGLQRPDAGTISIGGVRKDFRSPADAIAAGVGMVHQHFMLADNLTVLENIVLGAEPRRGARLDRDAARRQIAELGRLLGAGIDPDRPAGDLSVGARQRVEILKALYRGARILILDEPTAVLVPQEVDELFAALQGLLADGVTVLFISHKLDEVLRLANTVTILRAGRSVAQASVGELTSRELAELMIGRELPHPPPREPVVGDEALAVSGLVCLEGERRLLDGLGLTVHHGEILGVAGVEGNGQVELLDALLGMRAVADGRVHLEGRDITDASTAQRRDAGMGLVPHDRHRLGLLLNAPLWENAMLGHQRRAPWTERGWLRPSPSKERTADIIDRFDVRAPGVDTPAYALSGGNQQKLIFGREMDAGPRVLLAAEPTRGIDIGAQAAVWEHLRDAADAGLAVLLISSDLDELLTLADRLVVMLRGRLEPAPSPRTISAAQLGVLMTGAGSAELWGPASP